MSTKNDNFPNEKKYLSNKSYDYLNEEELFTKICQIREELSIPRLSKNKDLKKVCCNATKTGVLTPIKETGYDYTILSFFSIVDSFDNENSDQIIKRWLKDSSKRSVIISPGNYGAIHIEYNNDSKTSGKIALIIALIFRAK